PCGFVTVLRRSPRRRGALRGVLRLSRRLAPLLPGGLARVDIGAKAAIRRMPEGAVASDLGVLDLADELRQAPPRRLIRPRLRGERRRRRLVLLQDLQKVAKRSLVEAGADVSDRLQLPVAIHAEQQRAQRLRATALARRPPPDHALHRAERLDLHPRGRPRAWLVDRIEAFRDDPFDALLARRFEERDAGAWEPFAPSDRAHGRQRLVEASQALAQRLSGEVLAVRVEDVEDLIDDRSRFAELADGALVAYMHARLQALEARNALGVERHDLAVEYGVIRTGERLCGLRRLGILLGAVEKVARLRTDLSPIDEGDRAHPVPFRFVGEVGRVEGLVRRRREHRLDLR